VLVQGALLVTGTALVLLAGPMDPVSMAMRVPALALAGVAAWLWPLRATRSARPTLGDATSMDATTERPGEPTPLGAALERLAKDGELGTWSWNVRTGKIKYAEACATMLGYAPGTIEDSLGAWGRLVHDEDLARVRAALDAHVDGKTTRYESLVRVRAVDRSWRWILDIGRVVEWDASDRAVKVIGFHADVTAMVDQAVALLDDGALDPTATDPGADAPCVLVVDDDLAQRLVTAAMLQRLGYRVALAADGEHALSVYEANDGEFCTVLSDVNMPKLEGRALARELRSRGYRGPLILASGALDAKELASVREIDGFLKKPFDVDALARQLPARR